MAKKLSDELCRENYHKLRALFDSVIKDANRFEMVYACGVDCGMKSFVVVRVTTTTYASYAVGFDTSANEIVILPFTIDFSEHGEPLYLKHDDIKKAKQSFFTKEITIFDKRLPKKYIQLNVTDLINQDEDDVVLLHKQDEEYQKFMTFFKTQYKK